MISCAPLKKLSILYLREHRCPDIFLSSMPRNLLLASVCTTHSGMTLDLRTTEAGSLKAFKKVTSRSMPISSEIYEECDFRIVAKLCVKGPTYEPWYRRLDSKKGTKSPRLKC